MVKVILVSSGATERNPIGLAAEIDKVLGGIVKDGYDISDVNVSCGTVDERGFGRALVTVLYTAQKPPTSKTEEPKAPAVAPGK